MSERERERERETDTERERETVTERERERETDTERERERQTDRERETEREREGERGRETERPQKAFRSRSHGMFLKPFGRARQSLLEVYFEALLEAPSAHRSSGPLAMPGRSLVHSSSLNLEPCSPCTMEFEFGIVVMPGNAKVATPGVVQKTSNIKGNCSCSCLYNGQLRQTSLHPSETFKCIVSLGGTATRHH